ncbi:MAG: L,D-transpeptidase family protein [Bauldia sp.]|nr:L,D-transpeptidase family protein [Bauldia sp.]
MPGSARCVRSALAAMAAVVLISGAAPATAQNVDWRPGFDAILDENAVRTSRPILSPEIAAAMDLAILRYQDIVSSGGWPVVPATETLRLGMDSPSVSVLRQRLIVSGDLVASAGTSTIFDSYVEAAVRHFQARHGIPADGIVGPTTFSALNVAAAMRLNQLIINRDRLRELAATTTPRYVMVNLPAAEIEAVEHGVVVSRHTAVVGKVDRPSPILTSQIHEINFNPFWTVPVSIIRRDLIPLMQQHPTYLRDQGIRIYTQQGQEIMPEAVDWYSDEATRYVFRQDPGDLNSLGSVKINFHNPHAVYMHDTPNKTLFGNEYRFDSSGCVRVENIRGLIVWLLRDNPGWDATQINSVFMSGQRIDVQLTSPVRLYFAYVTAWAMEDGVVNFREDIYAMDGIGDVASLQ